MKMMPHDSINTYIVMFLTSFLSGILSSMNVWVDKIEDIRFSLNDCYMSLLMTGWMFLFTGLFFKERNVILFGFFLVVFNIWCIRTQFMISQNQFFLGMIPHHSMAIHMSKKMLEKENAKKSDSDSDDENESVNKTFKRFLHYIITTQSKEIEFMKI